MTAHDPLEKELATERKHDRMDEAELRKREAVDHNAAARQQAAFTGHAGPTTTGGHQATGTYTTTTQQDPNLGGYSTTQQDPRLGGHYGRGTGGT